MLLDKKGSVDNDVIRKAKETFGETMFSSLIYNRQRVKRYSSEGVPLLLEKNSSIHDKDALNMYKQLNIEILDRIGDN